MSYLSYLRFLIFERAPKNETQELELLQFFYEREQRRARHDNPALRRTWWTTALNRYLSHGWPLSLSAIEEIWINMKRGEESTLQDDQSLERTLDAKDATTALFDFSASPVVFGTDHLSASLVRGYDQHNKRRPNGVNVLQDVFLDSITAPTPGHEIYDEEEPGELDTFARAIADERNFDGIYCISGVRGSGKTTIMNRIAWYCRRWHRRQTMPLLVKFDLGTNFDREMFVRDLVAEICLEAKKALRTPPFSLPFGLNFGTRMVGLFGHFSRANISWTFVVAGLIVILLQNSHFTHASSANTTSHGSVSAQDNHAPNCAAIPPELGYLFAPPKHHCNTVLPFFGEWHPMDIHLLFLSLLGLLWIGVVYFFRIFIYHEFTFLSKTREKYGLVFVKNIFPLAAVVFIGMDLLTGQVSGLSRWMLDVDSDFPHHRYILFLVLISFAILLLPKWWESYLVLDRILSRVRSETRVRLFDMPVFGPPGPISWMVSRLLPVSDNREQVETLSEPFVQEMTKQALGECMKCFERIVILIDDIDAVPSERFGEVFRIVRPMSKVRGVRCVLATPQFFHFAFKGKNLGDLHSTVQASIVVGNAKIYPKWPEKPEELTNDPEVLYNFLVDLVASRLRTRVRRSKGERDGAFRARAMENLPIRYILDPWASRATSMVNDNAIKLLERVGTSRREIIRSLRDGLYDGAGSTRDDLGAKFEKLGSDQFEQMKNAYRIQENILDCSSQASSEPQGAQAKRRANRRRTRAEPPRDGPA